MKLYVVVVLLSAFYNSRESHSMLYRPATVVQVEGLEAQFLCQHPTDSGTIDWTIDGVRLRNIDTSDGSIRTEGRGAAVEALIIRALARYNGTEIVCITYARRNGSVDVEYSTPAQLFVQGQLSAVSDLKVISSPSSIELSWTQPFSLDLNDVNPDVVYCVDIYEVAGVGLWRDHMVSDCSVIEPQYSFTPANSDPLFQFIVTPQSNVIGTRNGTTSEAYLFNTPGTLSTEDAEVVVGISNDIISALIQLPNNMEIAGSRRPVVYEVTVQSVTDGKRYTCPVVVDYNMENTTLILNCTDLLQPHQLFVVEISGSNPAGTSTVVRGLELSTHCVQDINTISNTQTPGQVDISCDFIASNVTTLGYVALVYSEKEVHYLVTKNSNHGIVRNHLKGLGNDTYSTLLYTINGSGLPLQQAAAFPKEVTITGSESERTDQDTQSDVDISATISHINSQEYLIECSFRENSAASACVAVYWKNAMAPYQLVNFSASKLEPQDGKAQGSIDTEDGFYHVAVFAFSNDMISGEPIAKVFTGHRTGTSREQDATTVAVVTTCTIATLALAVIAITVAAVVYYRKRQRSSAKEESSTVTNSQPSSV